MRGGANALLRDGTVFGLGHATVTPSHHQPFQWSLNAKGNVHFHLDSDIGIINSTGFSIVDPTCIVPINDHRTLVGFCCSERDWFYDQFFTEMLLPATVITNVAEMPQIAVDVSSLNAKAFSDVMLGERLRYQVESSVVPYGGRRVDHQQGFVAFGQYGFSSPESLQGRFIDTAAMLRRINQLVGLISAYANRSNACRCGLSSCGYRGSDHEGLFRSRGGSCIGRAIRSACLFARAVHHDPLRYHNHINVIFADDGRFRNCFRARFPISSKCHAIHNRGSGAILGARLLRII